VCVCLFFFFQIIVNRPFLNFFPIGTMTIQKPSFTFYKPATTNIQTQPTDGLSGSVSATSGEVGLLGGTFGQGTVVKGQDRPPSIVIPGLDFVASPEGRQLLGYK
jgi:hypothetical protein